MAFTILVAILLIDAPIIALLLYADQRKWILINGIGFSLLVLFIGTGTSVIFHVLHMAFSGRLETSPVFYGLGFTAIAVAPLVAITYLRLSRGHRPGHCINCDYDLRGSTNNCQCPECGAPIR